MIASRIGPPKELDMMAAGHGDVSCRLTKLPGPPDRALLEVSCRECGAVSVVVVDATQLEDRHRAWIANRGAATYCVGIH